MQDCTAMQLLQAAGPMILVPGEDKRILDVQPGALILREVAEEQTCKMLFSSLCSLIAAPSTTNYFVICDSN